MTLFNLLIGYLFDPSMAFILHVRIHLIVMIAITVVIVHALSIDPSHPSVRDMQELEIPIFAFRWFPLNLSTAISCLYLQKFLAIGAAE